MAEYLKYNRRAFILNTIKAATFLSLGGITESAFAAKGIKKITILHTNDTHSRIDPFPDNDPKYPGLGGVARRMEIIQQIRKENEHVLLLDSGDIFQGTPYFNLFGGEVEFKAMSMMKYDAATLGNHDFDNGVDGLLKQLPHASFPFINSNYRFEDSDLKGKIEPYRLFEKGGIRIGVFGLGIELKGLVDERLTQGIQYSDPINWANKTANHLKKENNCDLVICLSHLGYRYDQNKISDIELAKRTREIDLILGGHTHTFLDQPDIVKNSEEKNVLIAQTGWAGIRLGRIDFLMEERGRKIAHSSSTVKIS